MNYLAHLFLAKPTADSQFGNLLGDFRRGVDVIAFSQDVQRGLENHYVVDKFTDQHDLVKEAKTLFHQSRRRYAPVAIDIYFDHLLIKHWSRFSGQPFSSFCSQRFELLETRLPQMPRTMQHSVGHMITHNWFDDYAREEGIAKAISVVAKRIRFKNDFHKSVDDIASNKAKLESLFLSFLPELIEHVNEKAIEN
ncbi:acyl carrier protein phosphodiesterase [Alteromonas sp. P256]|uniref:acyl carrier protein phosphodiesterase n=1 Tax=Alteromonas sp. P256 TaxID=3117399 RepID=UPI002FE38409